MRPDLPSGTVTFLFTDIEGSTKLLHDLGAEAYAEALAEHRRVLREVFSRHGGVEVDTQGDAFFVSFPTAPGALEAAAEAQEALAPGPIRVRMGLHTGTPHLTEEGYVGQDVHKGARIAAAGHGGQVLLSKETRELAPAPVTEYVALPGGLASPAIEGRGLGGPVVRLGPPAPPEEEVAAPLERGRQFVEGSKGMRARMANSPPLRRSTRPHRSSGFSVKTSSGSAGSTIHESSASSPSSCPGLQPV
jgi:class 3 adenylate cyclase